jgi:hypothetical protein
LTPDPDVGPGFPNAVREWCINTAAVDPFSKSIMVNSEDGKLYRWDLTTNTLADAVALSAGVLEAYTPTVIDRMERFTRSTCDPECRWCLREPDTPTGTPTRTATRTPTPTATSDSPTAPLRARDAYADRHKRRLPRRRRLRRGRARTATPTPIPTARRS